MTRWPRPELPDQTRAVVSRGTAMLRPVPMEKHTGAIRVGKYEGDAYCVEHTPRIRQAQGIGLSFRKRAGF